MSVADQSAVASKMPRRMPPAIRLSPQFVNRLLDAVERSAASGGEVAGLLFGVADEERVIVQAFKSFPENNENGSVSAGERMEQRFERLLRVSQTDPEVAALDLVGWYSGRPDGGLTDGDIEFHNRHFPQATDVALIVRPEESDAVVLELYTAVTNKPMTAEEHGWGSVRLETDVPVVGLVEVAMRSRTNEAFPFSAYPEPKRAAPDEDLPRGRRAIRRTPSSMLRPERETSWETFPSVHRISAGEPPGLPALRTAPKKRGVPWGSMTLLFVLAGGVTFALLLMSGLPSSGGMPRFLQVLLPESGLRLRVEGQGDRVLLSWNRLNPVVRSASDGVLHIDDGAEHRDVHLDGGQVANGAVSYRPASGDVTFRLEVHGQEGATVRESLRVLDGAKSTPLDLSASNPAPAAPTELESKQAEHTGVRSGIAANAPIPSAMQRFTSARPEERRPYPETARTSSHELSVTEAPTVSAYSSNEAPAVNGAPAAGAVNPQTAKPIQTAAAPNVAKPVQTAAVPVSSIGGTPGVTPGSAAAQPATNRTTQLASSAPAQAATPPVVGSASTPPPSTTAAATTPKMASGGASNSPGPGTAATPKTAANTPATNTPAAATSMPSAKPNSSPAHAATPPPANQMPADYSPPQPIKQVLPNVQFLLPKVVASVAEVEVAVRVDTNGRVTEAHVVMHEGEVPSSLAEAATNAAKRWRFEPARLHGKTVVSYHTIIFQFKPPSGRR